MAPRINLIHKQFGMLTVVSSAGSSGDSEGHAWNCRCECGEFRKVTTKKLRAESGPRLCVECAELNRRGELRAYGGSPKGWTYGGGQRLNRS